MKIEALQITPLLEPADQGQWRLAVAHPEPQVGRATQGGTGATPSGAAAGMPHALLGCLAAAPHQLVLVRDTEADPMRPRAHGELWTWLISMAELPRGVAPEPVPWVPVPPCPCATGFVCPMLPRVPRMPHILPGALCALPLAHSPTSGHRLGQCGRRGEGTGSWA